MSDNIKISGGLSLHKRNLDDEYNRYKSTIRSYQNKKKTGIYTTAVNKGYEIYLRKYEDGKIDGEKLSQDDWVKKVLADNSSINTAEKKDDETIVSNEQDSNELGSNELGLDDTGSNEEGPVTEGGKRRKKQRRTKKKSRKAKKAKKAKKKTKRSRK